MPLKHSPRAAAPRAQALPYRGATDTPRPEALSAIPLPPDAMPALRRGRPLKAWRYMAFFSPGLITCLARVRIGPARDSFWAVWDRRAGLFWQGRRRVSIGADDAGVASRHLDLSLQFTPAPGIETVCPAGRLYAWTAKRAPLAATATLRVGADERRHEGRVLVDDTAGYYPRHTVWFWAAGVGHSPDGQSLAWNLVSGVNDPPRDSERAVWVDGVPIEPPPCTFAPDLSAVDDLRFSAEATLVRRTNLGLVRSDYRQPMGTFAGTLPGGLVVCDGLGVMERHDAWW